MNQEIYVTKLKIKKDKVYLTMNFPNNVSELQAELVYHNQQKSFSHILTYLYKKENLLLTLPVSSLELNAGDWTLLLCDKNSDIIYTPVLSNKIRVQLILGIYQIKRNGFLFFPMGIKGHQFALRCRPITKYDGFSTYLKELFAFGTSKLLRPILRHKNIWIVYEKFCCTAQENGYYFFKYCMDNLPPSETKNIYFILDKDSPEWNQMKKYGKHIIPFMSFKHLLYAMTAKLYISPDGKSHLYLWKPKPNLVSHDISRHDIFFLQHGVTALKRIDHLFGKNGATPMTYFAVTSAIEQKIVTENLGYDNVHAPIVGFTRWDALEDLSKKVQPNILVMPTWRDWLEGQSDEFFRSSEYYKRYMSLLQNKELIDFLEKQKITLIFHIHPKLHEFLNTFQSNSPWVKLIPFGLIPINQLLMECSMMITDYSSACWDVYYQEKPVLFYHFDNELYEKTRGSYIDMEHDLFGERCTEETQLINLIKEYSLGGFHEKKCYKDIREKYFAFRDHNNCKRTYDYIKKQGY